MTYEFLTDSAEGTEEVGKNLAKKLEECKVKRAFIAMQGEMGVGKTAFTRGFASHFGITGVKSPTYTIVNEYRGRVRIFHFDMYRIEDEDDLYSTGYEDYIRSEGYTVAEWSENAEGLIPDDALYVKIERCGSENGRRIEIITGEGITL